jgi:hypothetical protein
MKKMTFAAISLLLLFGSAPLFAQADDDDNDQIQPARWAFQGRVGALLPGEEPLKTGAAFEINAMWRISGPFYAMGYGGIGNYESEGDVVPITDEFANFWTGFLEDFVILDVSEIRYRLNYGGGGVAMMFTAGRVEPILAAGIGAYQVKLIPSFEYVDRLIPEPLWPQFSALSSIEDSETFMGYMLSGGLYYHFNQIISFGGQATYHALDTDKVDDLLTFTFGMHINIP